MDSKDNDEPKDNEPSYRASDDEMKSSGDDDPSPTTDLAGRPSAQLFGINEQELSCPICMSIMTDPFVTSCGHTFCYSCISTHLQSGKNCPSCSHFLSKDLVHPNFLLGKICKKAHRLSSIKTGTAFELLKTSLEEVKSDMKAKELGQLVGILWEAQQAAEQREKEGNMQLLLHFLHHSKKDKVKQLQSLQQEVACLENDIGKVQQVAQTSSQPPWISRPHTSTQHHHHHHHQQQQQQVIIEATDIIVDPNPLDTPPSLLVNNNNDNNNKNKKSSNLQQSIHLTSGQPNASQGQQSGSGEPSSNHNRHQHQHQHPPPPPPPEVQTLKTHIPTESYMAKMHQRRQQEQQHDRQDSHPWLGVKEQRLPVYPTSQPQQQQKSGIGNGPGLIPGAGHWAFGPQSSVCDELSNPVMKKRRLACHFEDLQQSYLRMRAEKFRDGGGGSDSGGNLAAMNNTITNKVAAAAAATAAAGGGGTASGSQGASGGADELLTVPGGDQSNAGPSVSGTATGPIVDEGLHEFSRMLSVLSRCNHLRHIATIPRPSLRQSSSIVSSLEFDRDGGFFATAGVSKRISVFEYNAVVGTPGLSVHCPVVEMVTRSKLSCLSWNRYIKSHIASSDYEGVVTIWDVASSSMVQEYEAHSKRIWTVDFCDADPTLLASGSDDCSVRLWSTKSPNLAGQLDLKANICSVKWRPGSGHEIAVGSADHHVYLFDIRQPSAAVSVFAGHSKAVSYVKFFNENELVSSSTDSTLRSWDVTTGRRLVTESQRVYVGHENEKNFVGLALSGQFLACGSESDEAFVYYKSLSKPVARQRFSQAVDADGNGNGVSGGGGGGGGRLARAAGAVDKSFISAVCWKPGTQILAIANSQGTIKLMELGSGSD